MELVCEVCVLTAKATLTQQSVAGNGQFGRSTACVNCFLTCLAAVCEAARVLQVVIKRFNVKSLSRTAQKGT